MARRASLAFTAALAALALGATACGPDRPGISLIDDAGTRLLVADEPWVQREGESSRLVTGSLEVTDGGCLVVAEANTVSAPDATSDPVAFPAGSRIEREGNRVVGVRTPDRLIRLGESRGYTGGGITLDDLRPEVRAAVKGCATRHDVLMVSSVG